MMVMMNLYELGKTLKAKGLTIATAESCTAGAIGAAIASVDGASEYFRGGIICYATDIKVSLLEVPQETMDKYGVVSRETVLAMNRGVRRRLAADVAISISGYAGANGGDSFVPNGTIWICVGAEGREEKTVCLNVTESRSRNLEAAVQKALDLCVEYLTSL